VNTIDDNLNSGSTTVLLPTRALADSLRLPILGFGTAPLGKGNEVSEAVAAEALSSGYDLGVRFFDTAPWYGNTMAEHRLGNKLRVWNDPSVAVSTKVGRVYSAPKDMATYTGHPWKGGLPFELRFDYTHGGIMRSYEDSLQRMGYPGVDMLVVHDLDRGYLGNEISERLDELESGGGWSALETLRINGDIKAIGVGVNEVGMIPLFLERFRPDFFLVAMPYTLLDQSALEHELPLCEQRGVKVVIGSPFASGILASGVDRIEGTYNYRSEEIVARVAGIQEVCRRHQVPLRAAALQFPLGHPQVTSVLSGIASADQIVDNIAMILHPIPSDFWSDLHESELIRKNAPVPS